MINLASAAFLSVKIIILLGIAVYTIYAAVTVRQEQLMAHVLEENFEPILRLLSIIHLTAAAVLFLIAFLIL